MRLFKSLNPVCGGVAVVTNCMSYDFGQAVGLSGIPLQMIRLKSKTFKKVNKQDTVGIRANKEKYQYCQKKKTFPENRVLQGLTFSVYVALRGYRI